MIINPFENINNTNNIDVNENNITMWLEVYGRKKITNISGWNITENEIKEHLKLIKKKKGCNGNYKENIIQFQGDHIDYMKDYFNSLSITNIIIKG